MTIAITILSFAVYFGFAVFWLAFALTFDMIEEIEGDGKYWVRNPPSWVAMVVAIFWPVGVPLGIGIHLFRQHRIRGSYEKAQRQKRA